MLRALAERDVQPIVAVTPSTRTSLAGLVGGLREAGLPVAIWPMLEPGEGRWASLHTWPRFAEHVERTLEVVARDRLSLDELAIDLEPPIASMRRMISGRLGRGAIAPARATAEEVARWLDERRTDGLRLSGAVVPFTVAGPARVGRGWQRLFGTPVHVGAYDRVSVMAYSSLVEGYSRGFLGRRDALALVTDAAVDAARSLGARASLSLGCIGRGVLGDERCYRSPQELAEDVAVGRAAGIEDLAVFSLEGAVRRGPVEAWLDALVEEPADPARPAARPALRARTTLGSRGVRAISLALGFGADIWPRGYRGP